MPELTATWMWPQGEGGVRDNKRTVVLPGVLPGETVQARVNGRRGVIRATDITRLTDSPERQTPPCPHSARCGGCDLAHASSAARLRWLCETHARALEIDDLQVLPSPRRDARARVKLTVQDGVVGYREHRSHDVVAITECGIARPEIQAVVGRLSQLPSDALSGVQTIELRSDGERVVADLTGDTCTDALRELLEHVSLNGQTLAGEPTLWLDNGGPLLRASPGTFFQVNLELNRSLVQWVVEHVGDADTVADLYSGIGNFTLPLAAAGATVHAVEIANRAVADCAASARRAQLTHRITAIREDADAYDPTQRYVDALVLDPPRKGAGALMKRIVTARTPTVILVSCDPRAAARDTRVLREGGYQLRSAIALDLFPDTHHVELATAWTRT